LSSTIDVKILKITFYQQMLVISFLLVHQ